MNETDTAGDIDIRAITGLLGRQWQVIAYVTVIVLGIAILWLLAVTPLYTAQTLVQINTGQSDLLSENGQGLSNASTDNARMTSEVEILRSQALALAVVQNADLVSSEEFGVSISLRDRVEAMLGFTQTSEPDVELAVRNVVNRFQDALSVRRSGLTYLIQIGVTSESPETAARLANITAETYITAQVAAKVSSSLAARDVIEARLTQADADLVASEQAFEGFIDDNLDRIAAEADGTDIAALREELDAIRARGTQAEVAAEQARRALEAQDWQTVASQLEDAALAELAAQRAELTAVLADASSEQALNLEAALSQLDAQLEERSAQALAEQMATAGTLATQIDGMQDDIRSAVLSADLPSDLLTQIFSIQQRATLARTQYQTLLSRLRDFETQAELQVADARIVSPALEPINASFPNRNLVLALALVGGLGLGTALAFLREFYVGGFTSEAQVSSMLGVRVPAAMPRLTNTTDKPVDVVVTQQLSLFAESLRRLRASIDQSVPPELGQAGNPLVIMVASTLPGEGKTTTSLSLARTYALSGKRTLIIDCDLRKPSIASVVGLDASAGLLDYLVAASDDEVILKEVMAFDKETDLEIMPSVGRSNRPTDQLLTSKRFTNLIDRMHSHYEVIVIDTPPTLPVVDARYLARHADAIALVVKWAETPQRDVRQTMTILNESKRDSVPVFAVLNQQAGRRSKTNYQGYYGAY